MKASWVAIGLAFLWFMASSLAIEAGHWQDAALRCWVALFIALEAIYLRIGEVRE